MITGEKEKLAKLMASAIIRHFEGLHLTPYVCPGGRVTVGYGHRIVPNESVREITMQEAAELLEKDIDRTLAGIKACLPAEVYSLLTDNQLAALISFVFNIGVTAFSVSQMKKKIAMGKLPIEVAQEFDSWIYAEGKPLPGLIERRRAEKELFLSGVKNDL